MLLSWEGETSHWLPSPLQGVRWLLEGGELCVKMLGQRPVAVSPNRHRSPEALRTPKGGLLQGVSLHVQGTPKVGLLQGVSLHLQDFLPLNPCITGTKLLPGRPPHSP